jgi:hypothetical protein
VTALTEATGTGARGRSHSLPACPPRHDTLAVRKRRKTALRSLQMRPKRFVFFKVPRRHHATEDANRTLAKH